MRPISHRIINNLKNPLLVADWWLYQKRRDPGRDTYLVTMTAAGTHWIRMLFARALQVHYDLPETIDSIRPETLVPEFLVKNQRFKYNSRADIPRIQHSHIHYNFLFRNKRVILQVRDLRDAIVSHFKTHIAVKGSDISFSDFLRGEGVTKGKTHTLETRIDFLNGWHNNTAHLQDLHVIRFEDLKQNTRGELDRALRFAGFGALSDTEIQDVIAFASIENMKKLEQKNPLKQYKAARTRKVREGKTGSYMDYFCDEDRDFFLRHVRQKLINTYGYDYDDWNG